ncbi:coiled-coil domain-containing protein 86 [Sinocyclocheilus rhinocerous]|uniref:coiled-coil domain-containing protein 86 n=1 Tax=Sinocyclocheilus rhinocerous TaxID=307959 RepID=UPI0007B9AE0F|nr:PREDICTED: coiled-coil domain-containing protein 86-like [Sinocyclocheilus rhinocerous]
MMSASINKETDGGDGVAKAEALDNEEDSPIVSRTRSGRRLRTPAAKTPVRRTRKSVVREDPAESTESRQESPLDECTADTKGDQCSSVTEPVCPDVSTSTPADVSRESVPDAADLMGSDQASEKENVVNNTETESTGPTDPEKRAKKRTHSESTEKKSKMVPLGKPKSGRVWKDRNKQRFSALLRDKPLRTSWEKKMEAKREKQLVKKYHQQLKDEQTREKEEKKRRRAENLRRRAENERKAEIVQVIKNTAKIKRMKKKQLRKIEKRDTLSAVQKTPASVKKGAGKTNSSL